MSIAAAVPPPAAPGFQGKGGGRAREKEKRYGTPLPLLLPESPLHPGYVPPTPAPSTSAGAGAGNRSRGGPPPPPPPSSLLRSYAGILSPAAALANPQCVGVLDRASASVWVEDMEHMRTLFDRGFFGKGTLSRSDPSWRGTRVELLKGGSALAAEQVREKRRRERKQFKIDRAAAMLEAARKAEAVLTTGVLPEGVELVKDGPIAVAAPGKAAERERERKEGAGEEGRSAAAAGDAEETGEEGREEGASAETAEAAEGHDSTPGDATPAHDHPARTPSPAPSAATSATPDFAALLPEGTKLTAQTFLVRPTRPDANRNRGKKPKRRPAPAGAAGADGSGVGAGAGAGAGSGAGDAAADASAPAPAAPAAPAPAPVSAPTPDRAPPAEPESDSDDELVAEMEHLQLSLQEAWFLSAGLGVLKVLDPETDTFIPPECILQHFLTPVVPLSPAPSLVPTRAQALYPDDPLLVSYAAYHHYRSLGWCVRDGIKFCVDWLLYRRGPVFSHSMFSILNVPVYMDAADQAKSPYGTTDWYTDRMSWKWINTVMRVNSLVMKTIVIAYITIPALDSFPASARLPGGGLDPRKFTMRDIMERYTVREVSLTRFGPARRRD